MHILLLFIIILITGCQNGELNSSNSTTQGVIKKQSSLYQRYNNKTNRYLISQDGAPTSAHPVNFKEPKPAHEPISRYGNPTEYRVDGRSYEVLKSSSGYKTRGIASWYGNKFHKQRTSSGEPYNMYVMSAAHKTLPLPTYVKVKNLDNGKTAVVKVNDRGPFHGNRVIDLSYAAALKLGVFPKGTAHVEIETIMGPAGEAHYYLQAGAFSTEKLALQLQSKLSSLTPSPVFVEHYKQHYVVRVGPFANKQMADSLKTRLAHSGVRGAFSILV
jgi:rare lipoprotein A